MTIRPKGASTAVGIVAIAVLALTSAQAVACPIPVFQFALEFWPADPYEVVVHHNGELQGDHKAAADILVAAERAEERVANLKVIRRDYAEAAVSPPAGRELPFIEVRYPGISGIRTPLWEGPLEESVVEELIHSPLRQKIAEQLLDRKAAVWVLLESGDRRKDREARRLLETELPRLEKTLKVPDPTQEYGVDYGDIHTDIDFSLITLSRDDPDEQLLIRMLLRSERDLGEYEDKPMVFPIYGRGLILYAIIGDGINPWTLTAAGEFLTGPCSCQIKAGNPGVDILMAFDWESQVEQRATYTVPGMPDAGGFMDRADEAEQRMQEE